MPVQRTRAESTRFPSVSLTHVVESREEVRNIPQRLRNISSNMREIRALRVLVIDDEALLRWSLAEHLRRSGHTVIEATSASAARAAIADSDQAIDVVFLDYRLPDSNDLGLLKEVRDRTPTSGVVLMTAYGAPDVVQGALDLGAYCVVDKPFDFHGVEALAQRAWRAARPH
jgi:DNA-binding NtrC family response regulator